MIDQAKYAAMGSEWVADVIARRRGWGRSEVEIADELDRMLDGYRARIETDKTTDVPPRRPVQELHEELMADQGRYRPVKPKLEPFGVNAMTPAQLREMELQAYKMGKTPDQFRADLERARHADEAEGAARYGEAMRFYEKMMKRLEMEDVYTREMQERKKQQTPEPAKYRGR
jgi:hypothetical protein